MILERWQTERQARRRGCAHARPPPENVLEPGPWMTTNQTKKTLAQITAVIAKTRPSTPVRWSWPAARRTRIHAWSRRRKSERTPNRSANSPMNATRTAGNFNNNVGKIWQQVQFLRAAYNGFTMTLNPQQRADGANELAELSAGLDILEEAFTNYNNDVAGGRSENVAFAELTQVMREGARYWLQELDRVSARLLVGRSAGRS